MSHSIQKLNYEDHIRFLILQYPGDLQRVAEKASERVGTEVTIEEVTRIKQRMKRTMDRDVAARVAANLAQQVIQGSMERCAKLEAMFQMWDGKDISMKSLCCSAPAIEHPGAYGSTSYYTCAKCETTCGVTVVRDEALQKLKIKLIQEMRAESEHLIAFAKSMGFTAPQEPATVVNQRNNFLLVGRQQNNQVNGPVQIDAGVAKQVEDMSPVEREHLIHDLKKMAEQATAPIDAQFESQKEVPTDGQSPIEPGK